MWLPKGTVAELLFFAVVTSQWIAGIVAHPAAEGLRVAANGGSVPILCKTVIAATRKRNSN